jgi:hypothetical protein
MRWIAVVAGMSIAIVSAAEASRSRTIPARSTVGCDLWIDETERVNSNAEIVLDRIGLPRGRYPWRIARFRGYEFPLSAKWGVLIRAGTGEPVTISIARPWRRHAVIGWGNGRALSVRFLPCKSSSTWLVYAGGFDLKKLGCVPFDVQVGARIQRVRIAFGRSCQPTTP